MDDEFVMTFPVYVLVFMDGTGTIFLMHGTDPWLPLFTDKDAAQTYLERSEIKECLVLELLEPAELATFLRNPPSRAAGIKCDKVIVDPLDPGPRQAMIFRLPELLDNLDAAT